MSTTLIVVGFVLVGVLAFVAGYATAIVLVANHLGKMAREGKL